MTICDVSSLYTPTGGGIRTYYNARHAWFSRQNRHRYVLIVPGRQYRVTQSGAATTVEFRGFSLRRDPTGYRLLVDIPALAQVLGDLRPDVIETGDPWISGPVALALRKRLNSLVTSYYHSDVVRTYIAPWRERSRRTRPLRALLADSAERTLTALQGAYDLTLVGSTAVASRLRESGVSRVHVLALGVDADLFAVDDAGRGQATRRRLLFAGRLDADKDVDLLLAVLPALLGHPDVEVTVAGKGARQPRFEQLQHPRFRYVGFVHDREAFRQLLGSHHILLAPGRFETFGLSALEALAAGMVVVGPDAGGTAELLSQLERPFIFAAGEIEAFHAAIESALCADFATSSAQSRALARRYGAWDAVIHEGVALYERAVTARVAQ